MPERKQAKTKQLYTRTAAAVWFGLCTQATLSSAASAEQKATGEGRPSLVRKASNQMGVSVTVMPTCAVRLSDGSAVGTDGQPLQVRCGGGGSFSVEEKSAVQSRAASQTVSETTKEAGDKQLKVLSINF